MDSTTIIILLVALALGGGGGSKKAKPLDENACDPSQPIVYDGGTLYTALRMSDAKAGMTDAERTAMRNVMLALQSEEGMKQPATDTCVLEKLEAKAKLSSLGTQRLRWARVIGLLAFAKAHGLKGLNGWGWANYATLSQSARFRVELIATRAYMHFETEPGEPADTNIEPVPEEDEQLDVDPAQVSADALYLVEQLPAWGTDLPQPKWADAVKPAPFEHIGQSDENQSWESWLTNLLYWKWYPHLPTKVAGPNTPGAAEWKELHDKLIAPLVAEHYG